MRKINTLINTVVLSGLALTASASDMDLLETLYHNGVLNKAQFEKLSKQAEEKAAAESTQNSASFKAMEWASRIKIGGDMRVRQEFRDSDDKGVEKSRQRIPLVLQ